MFIGQMKGNTDVWQTTASVLQLQRRGRSQCIVSTTSCIDNNREFTQRRLGRLRKRRLKSEFALPQI